MSLFNPLSWFQSAAPDLDQKYSEVGSLIAAHDVGRPVWSKRDFESFAKEAYQFNAVAYHCIRLTAVSAANVKIVLRQGDKLIDSHPLLDLLARPGAQRSGKQVMTAVYSYLRLAGNSYLEMVGPENGPPLELWEQRPDRIKVVPAVTGLPAAYEYEVNGRKRRWDVNPIDGSSDLMHIKEFHPTDDWYGMSPIEPAATGVDRNNAAAKHNKALLDNGARPSGALVLEPQKTSGIDGVVAAPKDVVDKAYKQLMDRHGGPENAGKPMVLGGIVKWIEMGLSPKDMDFEANKDDSARDICLSLGVPPVLVLKGESTYNNLAEADLDFHEQTVLPLAEHVVSHFNAALVPRFDGDLELAIDEDSVAALEPRRAKRRESTTDLFDRGIIDTDEARAMLGYDERPDGMVSKVDAATITALLNAAPSVGIEPLARYMISVGLVAKGTTTEAIVAAALNFIEDDDDEDETTGTNENEQEDEDETDV